jgi:hypothetical protein
MKRTKTSLLLLGWLVVLLTSSLVHSASPYSGNKGNPTKPTPPPITPTSQGSKPIPIENPFKGNAGTAGDKK